VNQIQACGFDNEVMHLPYYKHKIHILQLRDPSSLSWLHTDTGMGISSNFSNKSIHSLSLLQYLWAMQFLRTYYSKPLMLY